MKQPKKLYIFVTSDRPDVYINIIGYCIEHYVITKVVFLGIVEDKGHRDGTKYFLNAVKERVKNQIDHLTKGYYLYQDQKTKKWEKKDLNIENHHKLRYAKLINQDIDTHVIVYNELDEEISNFLNSSECVFDVSGVSKTYLIDIYTLLLSKNINDIYFFELKKSPRTFDDQELIHNLSYDRRDYEYVNLSRSRYTDGTTIRTKVQEKEYINSIKLIEDISNSFAKTTLTFYAIISIIFLSICVILTIQGHWGNIEPLLSLTLVVPYILDIVLSIFKKEFSLKPHHLYSFLKERKLNSLKKYYHIQ